MFLINRAADTGSQARVFRTRTRSVVQNIGSLVYEGFVEPRRESRVVYGEMSRQILGLRSRPLEERTLMHLYAHSLVYGDGSRPPALDRGNGIMVEQMLAPAQYEYRTKHPVLSRIRAAA